MEIGTITWTDNDLINELGAFSEILKNKPIENNIGGMLAPHLFYTWFYMNTVKPKFVIESGVFKGQGTWAMDVGNPDMTFYCFDPTINSTEYKIKNAKYFVYDLTQFNWKSIDTNFIENSIVFLDDHVCDYDRIVFLRKFGFKKYIVEDNYPPGVGDQLSIKKILEGEEEYNEQRNKILSFIKVYYEFPPIFSSRLTRWGNPWNTYSVKNPLLDASYHTKENYKIYSDEYYDYTYFGYVEVD